MGWKPADDGAWKALGRVAPSLWTGAAVRAARPTGPP